jgi:hypothetical protein
MAASDILFADVSKLLFSDVRDIVKLAGKSGKGKAASEWLKDLGGLPPEKVAHELAERLTEALAREHDPAKRLALLASCEEAAEIAVAALEKATEAAKLPLPAANQQTAIAADSMLKVLATEYATLALRVQAAAERPDAVELLHLAALRATQVLARRHLLAVRGGAVPSPASWKLMRDVYVVARTKGCARTSLPDEQTSVEGEYVCALMFALADPGRLPRPILSEAHALIASLAPKARIEPAATPRDDDTCRFLIGADKGRPALALSQVAPDKLKAADGLVLDCSAVAPELERRVVAGEVSSALSPETLRLLFEAWNSAAARPVERGGPPPQASLTAGFDEIARAVAGRPRPGDVESGSDWAVTEANPEGFAIRHLAGTPPIVDIGDLVLLRPVDDGKTHFCLVRKVNNLPGRHLELALQVLCTQAVVVPLPSEDITAFGQQGLLLPQLPGFGNAAGLIAAAGAIKADALLSAPGPDGLKRYRVGNRISASATTAFHLLQPA